MGVERARATARRDNHVLPPLDAAVSAAAELDRVLVNRFLTLTGEGLGSVPGASVELRVEGPHHPICQEHEAAPARRHRHERSDSMRLKRCWWQPGAKRRPPPARVLTPLEGSNIKYHAVFF